MKKHQLLFVLLFVGAIVLPAQTQSIEVCFVKESSLAYKASVSSIFLLRLQGDLSGKLFAFDDQENKSFDKTKSVTFSFSAQAVIRVFSIEGIRLLFGAGPLVNYDQFESENDQVKDSHGKIVDMGVLATTTLEADLFKSVFLIAKHDFTVLRRSESYTSYNHEGIAERTQKNDISQANVHGLSLGIGVYF